MSPDAARCPHCGALQSRAPAAAHASGPSGQRKALRDVSRDEALALLAVTSVSAERAMGSASELRFQLQVAETLGFSQPIAIQPARELTDEVMRMLSRLIVAVRGRTTSPRAV